MSKYKLINTTNKEEHLCDKVTINGFDYYASDEVIKDVRPYNGEWQIEKGYILNKLPTYLTDLSECRLVIATNNPNIDIFKVVDEVERLTFQEFKDWSFGEHGPWHTYKMFQKGYSKSQETHPFSEEDMIEFAKYYKVVTCNCKGEIPHPDKNSIPNNSVEVNLQLWKEQQTKTIYYE